MCDRRYIGIVIIIVKDILDAVGQIVSDLIEYAVAATSACVCAISSPINIEGIVMSASDCCAGCFSDRSTDISGATGACRADEQPEQRRIHNEVIAKCLCFFKAS